jgi:flagellin-like protein
LRKLLKDKRGISPVITTVILVAVGIALAVAIGLWMSGLVATFTRFEKLEVTSAYAISNNDGTWTVKITAKNTGSADATITTIMVNGIPTNNPPSGSVNIRVAATDANEKPLTSPYSIPVGSTITFTLTVPSGSWGSGTLSSGITLNIVLHSAAGKDYPASVTLP